MIPVTGLNHAVLYVRELDRSVEFYKSVFGFEKVEPPQEAGDRIHSVMVLLRAAGSSNHHDLGLVALGAQAPSPPRGAIALYHLGWEVAKIEDLATAAQTLKDLGYYRGASDHGASKSIYGQDPDGFEFEIMWLVPREDWGEFEHKAIVAPLNMSQELKQYGSESAPAASVN